MKRILVLNYEFPPLGGGASPVSYELAKRLSEIGKFDIDVVTMGYKGLPKYEELNKNLRVHRVRCLRSKKEMCYPWEQLTYLFAGYLKCKELLEKNKYDICHCHFIIPTGVLALKLKKKFDLKYIITAHGSDVLGYNERFKNLYPFLRKPWMNILNNAKTVVVPSNFLKEKIIKVHPDLSNLIVIPNGIDPNKFKPQSKKKYILSSGRLMPNKGFQYLIQAVSDEDLGWQVHIAGDGPMMNELKKLATKSKTRIIFHGWLDNNGTEYKDLLEQSAIFVLMSEYESFGMVYVEALEAGCFVISADNPSAREILGEKGKIVRRSDVNALKKVLKEELHAPKMVQKKYKPFDLSDMANIYSLYY